jgi:hypothetical protein
LTTWASNKCTSASLTSFSVIATTAQWWQATRRSFEPRAIRSQPRETWATRGAPASETVIDPDGEPPLALTRIAKYVHKITLSRSGELFSSGIGDLWNGSAREGARGAVCIARTTEFSLSLAA